jgi:methylmalonyl-CoA/ethylmalonyl-CoA epimerase
VIPALENPVIHHVGLVVPSEEQATDLMQLLGLAEAYRGFVEQYQALCIFTGGNGASPLELVVPTGGTLAEFNGGVGGLHHVAFGVADLVQLAAQLEGRGIRLLEPEPIQGAGQFLCNFLPPAYTRGITVEFVQEQ